MITKPAKVCIHMKPKGFVVESIVSKLLSVLLTQDCVWKRMLSRMFGQATNKVVMSTTLVLHVVGWGAVALGTAIGKQVKLYSTKESQTTKPKAFACKRGFAERIQEGRKQVALELVKLLDGKFYEEPYCRQNSLSDQVKRLLASFEQIPIVVVAPKGAGKTTSVARACAELVENKSIGGMLMVDCAKEGVNTLHNRLESMFEFDDPNEAKPFYLEDLLPDNPVDRSGKALPFVFVLDNVDSCDLFAIRRAVRRLYCASKDANRVEFKVVVLCRDIVTASVLTEYRVGTALTCGFLQPKPEWSSLKWEGQACQDLLTKLETQHDYKLADTLRGELIKYAVLAGTPGFVVDAYFTCRSAWCTTKLPTQLVREAHVLSRAWDAMSAIPSELETFGDHNLA